MGARNGDQIKNLVREGRLAIHPFDENLVQPASIDLRIGPKLLASPLGPEDLGREITLNEKTPSYAIQTGQMVAVMSREHITIPLDLCSNSFGIRSEFVIKGLQCFGGPHLDPGWRGHLIVSLQNVGPEPINIEYDQPFFTVTFDRLEESVEPGQGYEGNHQNQDDFPEDQKVYILSARTTSLAEIPTLRENLAQLTVLVEEVRDKLPDPDAGLEINDEILKRLHDSLETPDDLLYSPEQMRRQLNL